MSGSVLKTVTLYKNNLGFYEREASFEGGSEANSFELEIPLSSKDLVVDTLRYFTIHVSVLTSQRTCSKPSHCKL